ncbi:phage tail tube protein [Niveispirillum sp. KHB5.9]|uniref:phage tail tube protein n=1 Tax=Niveispirillum sp. KHB5.9 TaxID=3400269 RepID=UPI003A86993E
MAGPYTWKEKLMIAKVETTYGTDAAPTAMANAIKTLNGQITPVEGDEVTLDVDYPGLGAPEARMAGEHVSGSFDVALCGAGTAGAVPSWGPVIRACGFAEVATEDEDCTYTPIQTGHESVTLYVYLKGALHKCLGVRGKLSIKGTTKNWLLATINFKGLLVPVTAASGTLPAASFEEIGELIVSDANANFTLDGFTAVMSEFNLDMGNDPVGSFLVGAESINLPDPVPTGSATFLDPGVGTKNFFALAKAGTKVALDLTHGTTAGNIVQIAGAAVQLGPKPSYVEVDQMRGINMPLRFTRHASGPLTITVK